MRYSSYYLYRKYEQRDGQDVLPVVPTTYSFDGEGTMPKVLHIADDPSCSEIPVLYRWVDMDISTDYWCDECSGSVTTYKAKGNKYNIDISKRTYSIPCNNSSILEYNEFYNLNIEEVQTLIVGNCVSGISSDLLMLEITSGISIPSSVTSIGSGAFSNNQAMTFCIIENGLRTIGGQAFSGCTQLVNLELPDSIEEIGANAFSYCTNLRQIHIPTGLTEISEGCFYCCIGILDATIPNGVTSIGASAFSYCVSLVEVTVPSTVTSIGDYAFSDCTEFAGISIPNNVTSIGQYAFAGCKSFTGCTIGSGITSIGNRAFNNCSNLSGVTINATTPPTLGNNAFYNTNDCPIYVPSASVSAYQSASGWSDYSSRIQAKP